MKHVWKCDFCSQTGNKEKIIEHEAVCSFNPSLQLCHSCDHHVDDGDAMFGSCYICDIGKNNIEIEDEKKPCKFWDTDDIKLKRKLKLNNIIN